jgi:hypothetical protein
MRKKITMAEIEKMPMEEKLALLDEADKAFIRGYIERAVWGQKHPSVRKVRRPKLAETKRQ